MLHFKRPSGTSGRYDRKRNLVYCLGTDGKKGIGECGILRGLSIDDRPDYEEKLMDLCQYSPRKDRLWEALLEFPSIQFGIEAFQSLVSETPFLLFPSAFTDGSKSMVINGLVWMGERLYEATN
jgi:hypothetical protein